MLGMISFQEEVKNTSLRAEENPCISVKYTAKKVRIASAYRIRILKAKI
jgi:hypothetical protein